MTDGRPGLIERVDDVLARYLDDRAKALADLGPDLAPLTDAARTFVLDGGKRLRPRFAYWGWRAVGGTASDDTGLVTAAAALELLHACALVHDDVMDASDTRRGRPSTHIAFADLHRTSRWTGSPDAFGAASAIVLGDILLTWSDALFASATIAASCAEPARAAYDDMRNLVMAGQYLDVLAQSRARFDADESLRVIELKTSKYTVEGPLLLGAAIGGAEPATTSALSAYGLALGEAFQLRDDVLGVFGDPDVTGKPAGDDLREGKQTLLTALAMRNAERVDADHGAALRRDLGIRDLSAAQIEQLRRIIVDTGALDEVEARIIQRADEADAALETDAITEDAREALRALIPIATRRRS